MKKVLFYSDTDNFGGHEVMSISIVLGLIDHGFDVKFTYSKNNKSLIYHLENHVESIYLKHFISHDYTPFRLRNIISIPFLKNIYKWSKRFSNEDKVVLCMGGVTSCITGLILAKLQGCRVLSYLPLIDLEAPNLNIIQRLYLRYLYCLHSEYVSISESLGEYIQNLAPKAKVYLAHNFTTIPQESNFEPIKDWGKKKNILLIGRLSSVKGFDSVFKAIDASIIMQENYHFHVYGTGEEYFKYSKFLSDMRVDNVTIYNKWVDVSIAFYKQFHLVLLPSFNEGFPMVMLESLISNIPFIASPTGGISDFLPESWILAGRESQDFISAFERADSGDSKSLLAQLANKINSDYSQAYAIEQWKLIL